MIEVPAEVEAEELELVRDEEADYSVLEILSFASAELEQLAD